MPQDLGSIQLCFDKSHSSGYLDQPSNVSDSVGKARNEQGNKDGIEMSVLWRTC